MKRKDCEPPAAVARFGWRYHHIGIPTDVPRPGEVHLARWGMHVSGFETSPYGIEWMRFDPCCRVSELVRSVPHVAFEVADLDTAVEGKSLLGKVTSPSPGVRAATIVHDGAPIELLEFRRRGRRNARDPLVRLIKRLEQRLAKALCRRNRSVLEALVAPDYEGVDLQGRKVRREQFLRAFTSPALQLKTLHLSHLSVRNYGDVTLVSGRSAARGAFQNKAFSTSAMFTDVWVRHEAGSWRLAGSQVTPVETQNA